MGTKQASEQLNKTYPLPFHQVGVIREAPSLPETLREPPVAHDARVQPPRDVVLLPPQASSTLAR